MSTYVIKIWLRSERNAFASIEALHINGCWAVHESYGPAAKYPYTVSHVPTGVAVAYSSLDGCKALADALPQIAQTAKFAELRDLRKYTPELVKIIPEQQRATA